MKSIVVIDISFSKIDKMELPNAKQWSRAHHIHTVYACIQQLAIQTRKKTILFFSFAENKKLYQVGTLSTK